MRSGPAIRRSSAMIGAASLLAGAGLALTAPTAVGVSTSSTVTVGGTGEFSSLSVTVSQTKDLVNQTINVSWTGAAPTLPVTGGNSINYLQIMQCWSKGAEGPSRQQCQFGGFGSDITAGQNTGTRQISLPPSVVDAEETEFPGPDGQPNVYVPFQAANGETSVGQTSQFFDQNTTNEVPYGRTRGDGTGQAFVEAQTGLEAPGLGCGQVQEGASSPPRCWLVIVPRGDREVDGTVRGPGLAAPRLQSSPLSTSNWKHRLVVPLDFVQLGAACPIGRAELSTLGTEIVAEAIGRWQPALCAGGEQNFGYSQVSDDAARRKLVSTSPDLTFMSRGLAADSGPIAPPVYAPVAVSGLTLAYNIESQASLLSAEEVRRKNGQRLTGLRFTPRLVLKLLTQSYLVDVGAAKGLDANPSDLSRDPEFLDLNPAFKPLRFPGIGGILLPLGKSDAIRDLWGYVESDVGARAFLAGKPDKWGMRINPLYKGMDLNRDDYPRSDLTCRNIGDIPVQLCTLDKIPFANDMFTASRAASRGDTLSRLVFDPFANPPQWRRSPPQLPGVRATLALVDTASAARFGLETASLRNAAGKFVAPTTNSLAAGLSAMVKDASTGLLRSNPNAKAAGAYPLPQIAYAATVPEALTRAKGTDYGRLIRYASGKGQQPGVSPGQLPAGYVPMTPALSAEAIRAARLIEQRAGQPPAAPSSSPSSTPRTGSTDNSTGTSGSTPGSGARPVASTTSPGPSAPASGPPASTGSTPVAATRSTPSEPAGSGRFAVVIALMLGGAALLARAALPWTARRLGR